MGELSRTIGELGENITLGNVLQKIGWRGIPNFDIRCPAKKKHNRNSHGIDYFNTYQDPLSADNLVTVVSSVKYNDVAATKSKFIDYVQDIIASAECIKYSSEYNTAKKTSKTTSIKDYCVLFWLNHQSPDEYNLLKLIGDVSADLPAEFDTIYLVDNFRITFLYKSITFAEGLFKNSSCDFAYASTGINDPILGQRKLAGKILPVEFINSPVLPFRIITETNQKILLLCLHEAFSDNSLRRLMGLAEGLTGGWCNKIILAFPDYQSSQHDRLKHIVYASFASEFADMVEVVSYNHSFKQLERNITSNFYNSSTEYESGSNIKNMLPFGDRIRQLLTQSYIYRQDLQGLLNRRGVFIDKSSKKSDLIPLISKMLLSPSEFDFLRRKQIAKESAEKISSSRLFLNSDYSNADLMLILKSALGENLVSEIILKNYENCHLASSPTFELDDAGDIQINFQIIRTDLSKDWTDVSSTFDGQVLIKPAQNKSGTYECRIDNVSTSVETKNISKQIIEQVIKKLKENHIISAISQPSKLLADSIASRSNFIFKFISDKTTISNKLLFKELLNVESRIFNGSNVPISEDIESLKNKVSTSVFSGHALQEISYVSNPKYREVFDYYSATCVFEIIMTSFAGFAHIEFGFPDLKTKADNKAEFEFKILDILPSDRRVLTSREYHEYEVAVREEFHSMKDHVYRISEKTPHQIALNL